MNDCTLLMRVKLDARAIGMYAFSWQFVIEVLVLYLEGSVFWRRGWSDGLVREWGGPM